MMKKANAEQQTLSVPVERIVVQQIGELIRTQDNRLTSYPLFIVQQKKRIWGMNSDYCENYEWIDAHDPEIVADCIQRAGLDALSECGTDIFTWSKVYYVDLWEFVTACFTEQACDDYIAANGHNLTEPRIYVASMYRNREMIAIREMLKSA